MKFEAGNETRGKFSSGLLLNKIEELSEKGDFCPCHCFREREKFRSKKVLCEQIFLFTCLKVLKSCKILHA